MTNSVLIFSQRIPCLARREVLKHVNIGIDEETTSMVELTMYSTGHVYNIPIRNEGDSTFFEGPRCRAMAEAEGFQGGHGEQIWLSFDAVYKFTVRGYTTGE